MTGWVRAGNSPIEIPFVFIISAAGEGNEVSPALLSRGQETENGLAIR